MNKLFPILTILIISGCNTNTLISTTYNTELSIHNDDGNIYIEIYDYPEIAGFQFDLTIQGNAQIASLNASGGLSAENNFLVSVGLDNPIVDAIVLGFSLTGDSIAPSSLESGVLVELDISVTDNCQIGVENVILSGQNGLNIDVNVDESLISIP